MTLAVNAIHRSLSTMAIEIHRSVERKRAANAAEALAEVDQQFQVDIAGKAAGLTWITVELDFDETFYDAPAQRDSNLEEPMFTHGASLTSGPPVIVIAHVSKWKLDPQGNFTGAFVRVGVWNPTDAASAPRFTGRVHLNFQGFSAPSNPDEDN